ncbi:MAG: glutathionylspermidine synthase family protein [Thiothrix sp.]|nr:glutathionylspermidine synthase family protein [Thiothrix sp.]HPQ93979.1 glutathionylspermidine synthase family protein [Thiolinea sp.]
MVSTEKVNPISLELGEELGIADRGDPAQESWVADELLVISDHEAEAYRQAANELYDMYLEAAGQVIDNERLHELDIPFNLSSQIRQSWEQGDRHLFGRFDLAGGIDGLPIRLLGFNADTTDALFETALVQWAHLLANGMDEDAQFNSVYAAISDNFRRLVTGDDDPESFPDHYQYQNILFSSPDNSPEQERDALFLQQMAGDAGFSTGFCYLHEAAFSADGVFDPEQTRFDYWFKLYPWEDIGLQSDGLTGLLDEISQARTGIVLNPAYTLLFQSKGMLRVLYELFPDSPYLLATDTQPLTNQPQAVKPMFGRHGANITLLDAAGHEIRALGGDYGQQRKVYQALAELPQDEDGRSYQSSVFYAEGGCGLGFRRGWDIVNHLGRFVSHRID